MTLVCIEAIKSDTSIMHAQENIMRKATVA